MNFKKGQRVVLYHTHPLHPKPLRDLQGQQGTVEAVPEGYGTKYLINFGNLITGRWWVAPQWLQPAKEEQ